jgi:predicted N-acetyltransferase YhbS
VPSCTVVAVTEDAQTDEPTDDVVGHAACSSVSLVEDPTVDALVLAPVAVRPDAQGAGIGSRLVRDVLDRASNSGYGLVFLHGSPAFYPRFGFEPAGQFGFENPFETPPEAFMVAVLDASTTVGGELTYPPAFDEL